MTQRSIVNAKFPPPPQPKSRLNRPEDLMFQGREPTWGEAKSQLGETQRWDEGMRTGRRLKAETQGIGDTRAPTESRSEEWHKNVA